jgi:hypothetical protein
LSPGAGDWAPDWTLNASARIKAVMKTMDLRMKTSSLLKIFEVILPQ